MSGHTPGPWTIVGADGYALGIWSATGEDVVSESGRAPMRQEDASLIAAAPELLEACRSALEYFTETFKSPEVVAAELRTALAKAEGKS